MGKDRKPLDQLDPGSVEKHKGRLLDRLKSPKIVGTIGNPPKWMTKEEKKIWYALRKAAPGQLGANDRTLLEITCVLKARLQERTITTSERGQLIGCLKQLGFIVIDRQPVAKETPENDELDDLGI
jgi:hypothetical protein